MRKEVENWWSQSKYDFETGKYLYDGKRYGPASFMIQQSVEKALKALYLLKVKESLTPTHSLVFLASKIEVPNQYFRFLKELSPEFVVSRYPDSWAEAPHTYYNKELLDSYFTDAKKVLEWIKSQIKKLSD